MLIGNVGRDPEVRYLDGQSGNAKVATFTLATTERYRDRNGETRENTEWHNIVAWRNTADVVERFVKKGTQLYIEGRIRTRSWDDQTGNKRYTTEIIADTLQLLGKKSDNPGAQQEDILSRDRPTSSRHRAISSLVILLRHNRAHRHTLSRPSLHISRSRLSRPTLQTICRKMTFHSNQLTIN